MAIRQWPSTIPGSALGGCAEVIKDVVEVLEGRSFLGNLLPTVQHDVI